MFLAVAAEYCTVAVSELQVPVEAHTEIAEDPAVMPASVSVVPERLACTTLGLELLAT